MIQIENVSRVYRRGADEVHALGHVLRQGHAAQRPDAAGDPDRIVGLGPSRQLAVASFDLGSLVGAREADRVGIDPHAAQRRQLVEAHPAKRVLVVPGLLWGGCIVGAHQ